MALRARPYLPLWQRGLPGFKVEPVAFNMWKFRYADQNGYPIDVCPIEFPSEAEALDHAADYWREHKMELQKKADERAAQERSFTRQVAPEV